MEAVVIPLMSHYISVNNTTPLFVGLWSSMWRSSQQPKQTEDVWQDSSNPAHIKEMSAIQIVKIVKGVMMDFKQWGTICKSDAACSYFGSTAEVIWKWMLHLWNKILIDHELFL